MSWTRCKITHRHSLPKLFAQVTSTVIRQPFFPFLAGSPSKWKENNLENWNPKQPKEIEESKEKLGETRRAFCAYTCKNELRIVFIFFLFGERVARNSHFRKHSWPRTLAIGLRLVGNVVGGRRNGYSHQRGHSTCSACRRRGRDGCLWFHARP